MLDTYNQNNRRDFNGRYSETYAFLVVPGKPKRVVFIREASNDCVYFQTESGGLQYHANIDSGVTFEFTQVDHGWVYRSNNSAPVLLQRFPARQWKRGISHSNTRIVAINGDGVLDYQEPSFDVIRDVLTHKQDYTVTAEREATANTIAISKHFLIGAGRLYLFDRQIGLFDREQKIITLYSNTASLQQEVMDACNRSKLTAFGYTIEVQND